jgi:8-oxo-dGTP pyrophosphatase MutT (NUDIX family)
VTQVLRPAAARFEAAHGISCVYRPGVWPWAEAERERIIRHWQDLKARQPALFDGEVLVLSEGGVENGVFRGSYWMTRYSAFITARDLGFPDGTTRNAFAMGALRAADGAFLLGIMGAHTANPGKIYFPAGTPDPSDIVDGMVDLGGSVARELGEETGLAPHEITLADDWTVLSLGSRIALMRRVDLAWDADEAKARIEANIAAQDEPELAGIHVVRSSDDIDEAMMPDFMKVYLRRELARA